MATLAFLRCFLPNVLGPLFMTVKPHEANVAEHSVRCQQAGLRRHVARSALCRHFTSELTQQGARGE
eukprot:11166472-Lingulodinium_polyedra.AAC.1